MLPLFTRRDDTRYPIPEEKEYVPRSDEGYEITPQNEVEDMGPPASLEDLNKAFSVSNASRLALDELSNSKIKSTFVGNDSYNLNILPTKQQSSSATIEDNWCSFNVETREQVGSYKDRLGKTVPIYMEKLPSREYNEPQVTKATRNMQLFTGTTPQEKKKESLGYIPDREENPVVRYIRASDQVANRQLEDLNSNGSHTQIFTEKDSCREGYNGYNLKEGHETRARNLIETNRTYYKNYEVASKGIDEDGQIPYVAEKTSRIEGEQFKRNLAIGNGGFNDSLTKRSIPIITGAKVVVKGRTGNEGYMIDKGGVQSLKHRVEKKETGKYVSEHGQTEVDSNMMVKSDVVPSNRQNLPENRYRQKGYETSISCRADVVPTNNIRDAFVVDGVEHRLPEHTECSIRPNQEREPGEDDPELEAILIEQTLNDCRLESDVFNNHDRTFSVTETYGEKGPEKMYKQPEVVSTLRSDEYENNHVVDENNVEFLPERSEHVLGNMDAKEQTTVLSDSSAFKQGRIHVPKERRLADKAKKNRSARMMDLNVHSENIRPEKGIVKSFGAQNIENFKQVSKFTDVKYTERPNMILGTSDAREPDRMSGVKGFLQSIHHIVPNVLSKPQLTSGTEQLKMPTGHLSMSTALPTLTKTRELKQEPVRSERMGSSHALVSNRVEYNTVPSHAKRGLLNVDRLSSNVYGKRNVIRDNWLPGLTDSKESGRGEHYRPPSAMSDAGSMCIPDMEIKKDSKASHRSPFC